MLPKLRDYFFSLKTHLKYENIIFRKKFLIYTKERIDIAWTHEFNVYKTSRF